MIYSDDWMGDVENAIAKKLGITPKPAKVSSKPSKEVKEEAKPAKEPKEPKESKEEPSSSSGKSSKHKRKHKSDKESQRKKSKLQNDDDAEKSYNTNMLMAADFDEYEMMNVRGGSPPLHGGSQKHSSSGMYYDSEASYSSEESETTEHRRRHRSKRSRANEHSSRRNHRGGNSKRDHKRRRDDSDDENNGHSNNTGGNSGGGGGGGGRNNNNNNQPRKAELCKFYLMECCAKGEKCLYMHSDFPCKFYYLGMNHSNNHNRETCKFSHGKPLTDQLRAVLLKHLETAPKEILGDFPRIARDNAINLINAQHQKLLVQFDMEPEPTQTNTSNNSQTSKLPSLLDINLGKYEPPGMSHNKKDKPRKSRWCDQRSNESDAPGGGYSSQNANSFNYGSSNASNDSNDVKLSSLRNVLTPKEFEGLSSIGIETINQLAQLTISQAYELRLDFNRVVELQQKAKKVGGSVRFLFICLYTSKIARKQN